MERHIKERLVGAGVLVLVGVLLIPEFLSGPADQADDPDSAIALPASEDNEMRSHTIHLDQQDARERPPVAQSVSDSVDAQPVPKPAAEKAAAKSVESGDTRTASVEAREPLARPPAENTTPQRVEDTPPQPGGWAVQVGSFSSADNANRLASTIESMGYESFVTQIEVSGKTHHRVRIGPMASRENAQKVASELQEQGQQAAVVTQP